MNLQEKIEEKANAIGGPCVPIFTSSFIQGAEFGYRLAIDELRSQAVKIAPAEVSFAATKTACWLESKLGET